jgi:hypothetical protein
LRNIILFIGTVLEVVALSRATQAQVDATPAQVDATPAQADYMPPAAAPPAQAGVCTPPCRSDYTCIAGQCVSPCNPPCAYGEQCRGGECILLGPPAAPPAYTPHAPSVDPGIEHHDGLMLRFTFGLGYASTRAVEATNNGDELTISGVDSSFSFDIGGVISDNLVLHLRLAALRILAPSVSLNGERATGPEDFSLTGVLIGPGLTYYLMPSNVYLTGALGVSRLDGETDESDSTTDFGFGANADIGKEWWGSDDWGLGIAARLWLTHLTNSEPGGDVTYNLFGFAVLFSATYN